MNIHVWNIIKLFELQRKIRKVWRQLIISNTHNLNNFKQNNVKLRPENSGFNFMAAYVVFFLKWYLLLTLQTEIRNVKYINTSKLYSAFGKIGKTIDVKMTAKVFSKNSIFALAWRTNLNMRSCCEACLQIFFMLF